MTSTFDATFDLGLPERFNLCSYLLDSNLEAGRGHKVAVRVGESSHTYGQIVQRVKALAATLRRDGLRPEERVLIVLPDGIEFVESWFACLRAGGVFAMVNPLLKGREYESYLRYSRAAAVITSKDVLPEIGAAAASAPHCRVVYVVGEDDPVDRGGPVRFRPYEGALAAPSPEDGLDHVEPTGPDDIAGWLFTSGSTGEPKACVHTHGDFAYATETYALKVVGYREDDLCLSVPKLFFGYATGTNLMFPFRVGATVALFAGRSTAEEILAQTQSHRPSLLTGVPTLFNSLLQCGAELEFDSLRVALSAGEALPVQLYGDWLDRTGVEILDGIGSAEMFHIYISNRIGEVVPGSLGRVVPGYEAMIVDGEGREVPDGEAGRLRVAGGSTALCYFGDKNKSNATFQGAWCTTADVFRRDEDGVFWYLGRGDDLLKVSGIWVSPLEIENALLGHDGVLECCVVGREDGHGLVKAHAVVVCAPGHRGSSELEAELVRYLKSRLAPHKYPRSFEWRTEPLPRNDRGKIQRGALK